MTRSGLEAAGRGAAPATAAALVAGALVLASPGVVQELDRAALDAFIRQAPAPAPSPRIAVVAVDEASLAAHGQWPWPRDLVARLVTTLADRGAAVLAFDVIFPEPDRMGTPGAAAGDPTSTDAAFAAAMTRLPVVTGFALTFPPEPPTGVPCVARTPAIVRQRTDAMTGRLFAATGAICDVPVLAAAAASAGAINVSPDDDGVLRRMPAVATSPGHLHVTLGIAAAATFTTSSAVVDEQPDGTLTISAGGPPVPLDAYGQLLLRPRGPGRRYTYFSAADVLAGRLADDAVRGRLVFIGATALGVRDTAATALDPRFPGVEVHATVADMALTGVAAARPFTGRVIEVAGAAAGAGAGALAVALLGLTAGASTAIAGGVAAFLAARSAFAASGAFVSPVGAMAGLTFGAVLSIAFEVLWQRRRTARERTRREQAQRLIVQTLTSLTETRDADTGKHAKRTQEYTRLVATALAARGRFRDELTPARIDLMATLAPLHDIGKVGVSDAVLHKPGHLTADEFEEMKRHTQLGHDTLTKAERAAGVEDDEVLAVAKDIVFTHHERWDGSGYPRGLRGEAIPLAGRIVAVVDTYDALVEERPYKAALAHDEALDIIRAGRGTHFDPDVVDAFLACHADIRRLADEADTASAARA